METSAEAWGTLAGWCWIMDLWSLYGTRQHLFDLDLLSTLASLMLYTNQ
jgi:hypothetical protein